MFFWAPVFLHPKAVTAVKLGLDQALLPKDLSKLTNCFLQKTNLPLLFWMVIGTTTQTLKLNVEKQLKKHVETILNMILGLKKSEKIQKKSSRGVKVTLFWPPPPGIFRFFTLPLQALIYTKTATGFRTLLSYIKIIQSFILIQNTKKQVWIGGGKIYTALFFKKVPFPVNIGHCPNFLD